MTGSIQMNAVTADFSELSTQTFVAVEQLPSNTVVFHKYDYERTFDSVYTIVFTRADGVKYVMGYEADCCASCEITDLNGDLSDLVGVPITLANESYDEPEGWIPDTYDEMGTWTWTFYRLATCKGHVDIRWFGSSNGYYSESVSFYRLEPAL